jgi:hypothetical protein
LLEPGIGIGTGASGLFGMLLETAFTTALYRTDCVLKRESLEREVKKQIVARCEVKVWRFDTEDSEKKDEGTETA